MKHSIDVLSLVYLAGGSVSVHLGGSLQAGVVEEISDLCIPLFGGGLQFELNPSAVLIVSPRGDNACCDFMSVGSEDVLLTASKVGIQAARHSGHPGWTGTPGRTHPAAEPLLATPSLQGTVTWNDPQSAAYLWPRRCTYPLDESSAPAWDVTMTDMWPPGDLKC